MVGSAGNAPVVIFQRYFVTADLQAASWITSLKWLRGQESHLPDEVYEASLCTLVEFPAIKWWSPAGNAPA